jgi:hypothetical protein
MTRVTFSGIRNDRRVTVTWTGGALSGDLEACRWIQQIARMADSSGTIVGAIGGPYSMTDHLADPYAARALILSVYPGDVRQEHITSSRSAAPHLQRPAQRPTLRVVWEDGALFGDLEAVAWIRHVAALLEGQIVGAIGAALP